VVVVDTVGAGDAFVGTYLSSLIRGSSHEAALLGAVRADAWAVTVIGDSEVPPTDAELQLLDAADGDVR
jgi:2-dehydro-3-deoxygluconokinase